MKPEEIDAMPCDQVKTLCKALLMKVDAFENQARMPIQRVTPSANALEAGARLEARIGALEEELVNLRRQNLQLQNENAALKRNQRPSQPPAI
jgi:hypothetical protein